MEERVLVKTLKNLSWNDNWQNYVQYGQFKEPLLFDSKGHFLRRDLPDPDTGAILSVMHQLKENMSVYEAYLKGVEFLYSSYTYNQSGIALQRLIKLKKQDIKNLKKAFLMRN